MTDSPTPDTSNPGAPATDQAIVHNADLPGATPHRPLTEIERRVLEEAAARRAETQSSEVAVTGEDGGPRGPEPTRYGDWERKGLAVDF